MLPGTVLNAPEESLVISRGVSIDGESFWNEPRRAGGYSLPRKMDAKTEENLPANLIPVIPTPIQVTQEKSSKNPPQIALNWSRETRKRYLKNTEDAEKRAVPSCEPSSSSGRPIPVAAPLEPCLALRKSTYGKKVFPTTSNAVICQLSKIPFVGPNFSFSQKNLYRGGALRTTLG